ncbi:MAG TPA: (2Fe-2S)-binding protein [Xanthobacteraceae bacterium]|nr:(2Fe-2S)-binding protein [Xanthobacteraceae bacterium]
MSERVPVSMIVNGEEVERFVEPRTTLGDFLRTDLELTGTHLGCEMGVCGACLVLVNGKAVHSCLMLAVAAEGESIQTVEGLSESKEIADIQRAFHNRNALQCGFCTPGVLVTAHEILKQEGPLSREEIRDGLSGNYCRCTGYEAIVDAIEAVLQERAAKGDSAELAA